jgi:hypothetical protein
MGQNILVNRGLLKFNKTKVVNENIIATTIIFFLSMAFSETITFKFELKLLNYNFLLCLKSPL